MTPRRVVGPDCICWSGLPSDPPQTFRFLNAKSESLFLQRKNPQKIAWTQVYRRMHKKGITEEVAKKRSRKNVKVQVGVIGRGCRPEEWIRRRQFGGVGGDR